MKHYTHTHTHTPLLKIHTHTHTPLHWRIILLRCSPYPVDHTGRGWSKIWKMTLVFFWIFTATLKLLLLFPCAESLFFSEKFKLSDCITLQKKFLLWYNRHVIFIWPHDLIFVCVLKWLHFVQLTFITIHTYIFLVIRHFKIHFLSSFPIWHRALLTVVTMLCIYPHEVFIIARSLLFLTPFTHSAHTPTSTSGNYQSVLFIISLRVLFLKFLRKVRSYGFHLCLFFFTYHMPFVSICVVANGRIPFFLWPNNTSLYI